MAGGGGGGVEPNHIQCPRVGDVEGARAASARRLPGGQAPCAPYAIIVDDELEMATTFRFTAMSDPSLLARATDLQTCGTLQDVPSLTGFLGHADPTLKASACAALAAIAQRTDSSAGEAGRTLKDARQRLTDLARLDGDDTVRAAASVAVAAVAAGTSYLPAWPMPEPSPSLKRPPSGATTPLTDHAGHAAPSFAATSVLRVLGAHVLALGPAHLGGTRRQLPAARLLVVLDVVDVVVRSAVLVTAIRRALDDADIGATCDDGSGVGWVRAKGEKSRCERRVHVLHAHVRWR